MNFFIHRENINFDKLLTFSVLTKYLILSFLSFEAIHFFEILKLEYCFSVYSFLLDICKIFFEDYLDAKL